MKKPWGIFLLCVIFLTPSCIFGPSAVKVMGYRNDRVILSSKQTYSVGELPSPWKKMRVKAYAVAFHNPDLGATIATDAFCGPAYEGLPLPIMTSHLLAGVTKYNVIEQKSFILDGRGALRTTAKGDVDGVPLMFDIVVISKNKCNIDLMCISPPSGYAQAAADFEIFYSGFRYQ